MYDEPFHHKTGKRFHEDDIEGPLVHLKDLQSKRIGIKHNWGLTVSQNILLLTDPTQRIIFLTRDNAAQREVSLHIAQHTQWWSSRDDGLYTPPNILPSIDIDKLFTRMRRYQKEVQLYRTILLSNTVPFFELRYEDMFGPDVDQDAQLKLLTRIGTHIGYDFTNWTKQNTRIQETLTPSYKRSDTEKLYRLIPNIETFSKRADEEGFGSLFD